MRRSHNPQHWKKVMNSRLNKSSKNGEVSEWLKEHAWKVCIRQRIEGSNPSLTAKLKNRPQGRFFASGGTAKSDAHGGRVRTLAGFEQSSLLR